ncbi:Cytochrome P450 3A31 [Orchesella cincta]|uniref:Cytochrome P450 3A31 n=1 Tax=Orchesella cincta TaxID=48709 RepID=A0A1D2M5Y0_ORCCI|nr:Cytochrome P450 3A31 [Orchesella cincta]
MSPTCFSAPKDFCTFTLYVLAVYQDIQEKVREEVNRFMKDDGTLAYDDVGKLDYLDMVFCEVLRKYPPGFRQERVCTKDYNDPETGLFVPKGTLVAIPMYSFHNDKQYFDNPDKFDPEHFTPENKAKRHNYSFMPWGYGPRSCLGMRLALIECKSFICHIVHRFSNRANRENSNSNQNRQSTPPTNASSRFGVEIYCFVNRMITGN